MFGSTVLDVAIGMVFVYSVFSLIASKIDDLIAAIMNWRAKYLEEGVRTLLGDPGLMDKVWNHPLVQGLVAREGKRPTNIPPNTFALALFDSIVPQGNNPTALAAIRAQVANMSDNSARKAILAILDSANGDMEQARVQTAAWFDSAMDRVSGLYKQQLQTLSLLVALVVSVLFNVDTLAVANGLWQEPTLRAAIAGAAALSPITEASQPANPANSVQGVIAMIGQFALPIGWNALPSTVGGWFGKGLGLAMSAMAISMGAPFWYDLLKNLSALRQPQPEPLKQ